MKKLSIILLLLVFAGCADQNERFKFLRKEFPKHKIIPASGHAAESFDFVIIDSTGVATGVDFYPGKQHKISRMRRLY